MRNSAKFYLAYCFFTEDHQNEDEGLKTCIYKSTLSKLIQQIKATFLCQNTPLLPFNPFRLIKNPLWSNSAPIFTFRHETYPISKWIAFLFCLCIIRINPNIWNIVVKNFPRFRYHLSKNVGRYFLAKGCTADFLVKSFICKITWTKKFDDRAF